MQIENQGSFLTNYTFKRFFILSLSNTFQMITDFFGISVFYYILKFERNLLVISAVGMSFTYTYFIMFFMFGFSEYLGIAGCNLIAAKKYKQFRIFIAQLLIIFGMVSLITIFMGLFCNVIFEFFGFDSKIIDIATPFIRSNLPERLLEPIKQLIVNLVIYFEKQSSFTFIFTISTLQFIFTLIFFNYIFDIGLYSYTISRIIKTSLETYLIWKVLIKCAPKQIIQIPDFQNAGNNFQKIFKNCIYSLITVYGEGISNEMTSFFVLKIPSLQQQASWMLYCNIFYYVNVFGVGQGQTFRSKFNQLKGMKYYEDIYKLILLNYKYCFMLNITVSIVLLLFKKQIASILTLNFEVQNYLENLLTILALFIPFLVNKFSIGSLVRSMGFFDYTFKLSGIFYPLNVFVFIYIGLKYFFIQIYAIILIYLLTDLLVYTLLTIKYLKNKNELKQLIDEKSKSQVSISLLEIKQFLKYINQNKINKCILVILLKKFYQKLYVEKQR